MVLLKSRFGIPTPAGKLPLSANSPAHFDGETGLQLLPASWHGQVRGAKRQFSKCLTEGLALRF